MRGLACVLCLAFSVAWKQVRQSSAQSQGQATTSQRSKVVVGSAASMWQVGLHHACMFLGCVLGCVLCLAFSVAWEQVGQSSAQPQGTATKWQRSKVLVCLKASMWQVGLHHSCMFLGCVLGCVLCLAFSVT
jgi:hypothetical protein